METLNRNHISYQEMDGLIELAEKVSGNIEKLKNKIRIKYLFIAIYTMSGLMILTLIFSDIVEHFFIKNSIESGIISALLGIILGVSFVQIVSKFFEVNDNKSTVIKEKGVLQKLLNMIEGYKDLYVEDEYGNNQSVVSKALFEMRLSRINFEVK